LLGKGDLLFLNPESGTPLRAQGVIVTDQEIEQVAAFWQKQRGETEVQPAPWEELITQEDENGGDELVQQAIEIVKQAQRASASLLQRRLRIGYPRAARLIDQLEEMGVVGPRKAGKDRTLVEPTRMAAKSLENAATVYPGYDSITYCRIQTGGYYLSRCCVENTARKEPVTFTDYLRKTFKNVLDPIAAS
jgi:hypothetical protein